MDTADVECVADRRRRDRGAVLRRLAFHDFGAGHRIGERAHQQPSDPTLVVDPRDPADMVEVEVGQDEQRDLPDAQARQAPVDQHRVRAGVDLDGRARARVEDEPVALPDVAGGEDPAGRRPVQAGDRLADWQLDEHRPPRGLSP